jgi:hypothetical protein
MWPFDKTENTAAITTRHVIERTRPVRTAVHYSDDHSWAFLCGTTDETEDGRVISMREAVNMDETLLEIADLPPGWIAWRSNPGAAWSRKENRYE